MFEAVGEFEYRIFRWGNKVDMVNLHSALEDENKKEQVARIKPRKEYRK